MVNKDSGLNSNEKNALDPHSSFTKSAGKIFEIHVRGQLDSRWSEWLEGLEVRLLDNGDMALCGPIPDQAALLGVLNKLSRLNLALVSVNEVKKESGLEEK